jgi:hypothetical protein
MKKGDKVELIRIDHLMRPATGHRMSGEVVDNKVGVATIVSEAPLTFGTALETKEVKIYSIVTFIAGGTTGSGEKIPAVVQIRQDERMSEFFTEEKLAPYYDVESMKFVYAAPENSLDMWAVEGVLDKVKNDSYLGCPICEATLVPRHGCSECWSCDLTFLKLRRHVKCGYIGMERQFDGVYCPNCQELLLEKDLQSTNSPAECGQCRHMNMRPYIIGTCVKCIRAMPLLDGRDVPVYHYRRRKL